MQPHAADRFVDSVGVCTHLESEPYNQHFDAVLRMGAALGVRHIRDELRPDNQLERWRRLFAGPAIRSHLLVSPATNTVAEMIKFVTALGPSAVSAIEGQNEGDSAWFKAQDVARPDWAEVVIGYQRAVFQAVRAHAGLRAVAIVSPSVLDYAPDDMRLLRAASPYCDVVALHAYLQGQQEPETEDDFAAIEWYLSNMRGPFKPLAPAMVTETGYATDVNGISLQAAGIYLPRLVLLLFERGIVRSFLYELMDEGYQSDEPEQKYGLLTADAAPKPAFHTLRRLLGALADPGPPFAPAPIALAIEHGPLDLHLLPFRKRSGEIVLAVWRAARVWDPSSKSDLTVAPASVRLLLPPGSATMLLLADDTTWSRAPARNRRLEFELSGTPVLIRLVP